MFAWIWFLATVSSAASWCRKPMGLSLKAGSPSRSSIFSMTPSRRAATEDFSIQSTVASSSSTSAVTAGLAGAGWSWPFWANVATLRVVSSPRAMAAAVLAMVMVKSASSFEVPNGWFKNVPVIRRRGKGAPSPSVFPGPACTGLRSWPQRRNGQRNITDSYQTWTTLRSR